MALRKANYNRPWLAPYQTAAFFCPERYSITEATTKSGKTTGAIVWLFEQAGTGGPGDNYWWIAPIFSQAKIAFRRMKRAIPRDLYIPNETEMTITLCDGAMIWFKGADHPDSLYGENVKAAVIDEASRVKGEAWYAVRSTLTQTRGPLRIIGNVKGRKNWAYKLARLAEGGAIGMSYHKITCYDAVEAGILEAAEIEDARRLLPERVFKQLYLAEPADDEGNPFGAAAIRACIAPMTAGPAVAHGWDLAKSVDWTVGVGLDAAGAVCSFDRFQLPWEATIPRIVAATTSPDALVDGTGVGDPIVERLQSAARGRFEGFKFSSSSKQQLMEGLALAIQQRRVTFPEGILVSELESFEYEYTRTGVAYSAPEGMHDDCVCALALAVRCLTHPRLETRIF